MWAGYQQVIHDSEECQETLAFATESVACSLSNVFASRQMEQPSDTAATKEKENPGLLVNYNFLPIELKYGLLQVIFSESCNGIGTRVMVMVWWF